MVQPSKQLELPFGDRGEAPKADGSGQAASAESTGQRPATHSLKEAVLLCEI